MFMADKAFTTSFLDFLEFLDFHVLNGGVYRLAARARWMEPEHRRSAGKRPAGLAARARWMEPELDGSKLGKAINTGRTSLKYGRHTWAQSDVKVNET